jgi:glucosamine--fructose-6-phosphate aminotransferase (isomerizing)
MNRFLKEIEEQPGALKDTLQYYIEGEGRERVQRVAMLWQSGQYEKIIFTGMGSSYFISYAATCLLNCNKINSFAINAGELLHYQFPLLDKKILLVCISQSGESFEIVKIMEQVPPNITVIAISNEPESTLVKKAQVSLLSIAGKEEMTTTKTFITSYLVTYILSLALSERLDSTSFAEMETTIQFVSYVLNDRNKWLSDAVRTIAHAPFVQLVARGPVFATAQQSALMLMEATRNPAAALLGGEFRHGPMEMIKDGSRVVIFAPGGKTYTQNLTATSDVLKFGAKVLLITDQVPDLNHENLFSIIIPCVNEELFAISSIIPMQLIVNQWSIEEKNEPGNLTR